MRKTNQIGYLMRHRGWWVLREPVATAVATAAFTGLRLGELRGLTWEAYEPAQAEEVVKYCESRSPCQVAVLIVPTDLHPGALLGGEPCRIASSFAVAPSSLNFFISSSVMFSTRRRFFGAQAA